MTDQDIVLRPGKLHYTLRHTTHDQILAIELHGSAMQRSGKRCIGGKAFSDLPCKSLLAHCIHKLLQVHRIQRFHVHLSDRKREFRPVNRYAKQAARRNNMVVRCILTKIFQRSQRPLA